MARRRFFVKKVHDGKAELCGAGTHHLTGVLRVARGQRFEISDNRSVWLAEVTEARRDRVVFRVIEELPSTPEVVHLTLLLALVKFDRFEMALEKGTEAGVAVFIPVLAERSEKGLDRAAAKRIERWRRILLEAGQQSRRDTLPVIDPLVNLRAATAVTAAYRYLLDEQPGAPPLLAALPDHRAPGDSVAVLVGPEGGWTPAERELAVGAGWSPVSLGPLLLRTETAAVAAAAIVFNAWWAAARK